MAEEGSQPLHSSPDLASESCRLGLIYPWFLQSWCSYPLVVLTVVLRWCLGSTISPSNLRATGVLFRVVAFLRGNI